jgi:hypothetical protein
MESMSIFFELKNVSVLFIIPPPPLKCCLCDLGISSVAGHELSRNGFTLKSKLLGMNYSKKLAPPPASSSLLPRFVKLFCTVMFQFEKEKP